MCYQIGGFVYLGSITVHYLTKPGDPLATCLIDSWFGYAQRRGGFLTRRKG
jgi:hypothetical protein